MKKIILLLLCFVTAISCFAGYTASADYYITNTELYTQEINRTYDCIGILGIFENTSQLNKPQGMTVVNDKIYIADTGNNRVLEINKHNQILNIFDGEYKGRRFNQPQGLFVDDEGHIFVADTENGRIVHLNSQGGFIEEFVQPVQATYDSTFEFKPIKVAVDHLGIIYIINAFDYHGIITIDPFNQFLGYLGMTKIGFSLTDSLLRVFATKEQKEILSRQVPAYFSDFKLKDGMIYTTSLWESANQIKKLTPAGFNVFPSKMYGEKNDSDMFNSNPGFVSVAIDKNSILYSADLVTGKIYVYDTEGRNLAVFGGEGRRERHFETIVAIEVDCNGDLYVLDMVCGYIQVFKPTKLMQNVLNATVLYNDGKYNEAEAVWQNVLELGSTNALANMGLAKSEFGKGNFKESMDLYYKSFDKEGYSQAFSEYRLVVYQKHFWFIALAVLCLGILAIFMFVKIRRYANAKSEMALCPEKHMGFKHLITIASLMIMHPNDCFNGIKAARKKLRIWHIATLFILIVVVNIAYIYLVHYPLSGLSLISVDVFQQIAVFVIPLISFILVFWGFSSVSNGKQKPKEIAFSCLASFIPYILFQIPLAFVSHLLSSSEAGFYSILNGGILVWCLLLFVISLKNMNEYSLKKLFGMIILTAFGVVCLWMIVLLFYIIVHQAFMLIKSVISEYSIFNS